MRYLFFLISFLYSAIFFLFYKFIKLNENVMNLSLKDSLIYWSKSPIIIQSIFWNLLIESIIFLVIWILLFFYFTALKNKHEHFEEDEEEHFSFSSIFSFKNILYFLKKFSYYIWFLLFYVSLYLMSKWFDFIEFSTFIMLLNVIIYVYFFASKYSKLSLDFLKVNSVLFSLTYIFAYFYLILTRENLFWIFDFINSFLIIFSFWLFLYYDKLLEKKKKFDEWMLLNLSFYIFFVFLFYFYHYIFKENLLYWLSFLTTVFWIVWFEALPRIDILKWNKLILKYFWIFFSYFWILFSLIYLIVFGFSYLIFIVLFAQIIYNIFIHKKYINFISFWIWIFLIIFLIYYLILYFEVFSINTLYFLLFSIVFSFTWIVSTYYLKLKYMLENYVIHIFSYIANLISILIFLIFNYQNFAIFYIGLLLLTESFFFFLSYNKLNTKKEKKSHH
jgi:hypothetical protein